MYTSINNFRYGLDTRRSELSTLPGALIEGLNGHINQGGEFEKRKAFVATALPAGTYGFQETANGIYVFGTLAPSAVANVAPILYQQLLHPKTSAGLGAVAFTRVVYSTQFNDLPWVIVLFADGSTWEYYNGELISDFLYGYVAPYMTTNSLIAASLAEAVNASGDYTATQNVSTLAHKIDVFSQPGNSYNVNTAVAAKSNITISSVEDVSYTGANVFASSQLNTQNLSTMLIGGVTYRFMSVMTQTNDVQIGNTISQTIRNLYLAIGATGVAGTNYFVGTVANTVVYAQSLVLNVTPTFRLLAFAPNTQGVTQNTISGVTYVDSSETVEKQIATQAVGQFSISQIQGSVAAGGYISIGTFPLTNGDTFTINGRVYTIKTIPTTADDVLRNTGSSAFGYTGVQLQIFYMVAIINGSSTYTTPDGLHTGTAGIAGTPNADVIADQRAPFIGGVHRVGLTAIIPGTAGNTITLSEVAVGLTVSGATLANGTDSKISSILVGSALEGILSTGTIATNGVNVTAGDKVTLGNTVYTFVVVPTVPGDVLKGTNALASLTNLLLAVNGTGTQGLNYNIAGVNPLVTALATLNGNVLQVTSRLGGTAANSIAISTTAVTLTTSGLTLTGGKDTVELLSAAVTCLPGMALSDYAILVFNAINSYTPTSGYYAKIIGNVVYIYAFAGNSFSNSVPVTVTVVGKVCIGFCAWEFNAPTLKSGVKGITGTVLSLQVNGADAITYSHALGTPASNAGSGATSNTVDTTIVSMCNDIVLDFLALSGGTYTAIAVGSIIYISKLVTTSEDAPLNVAMTLKNGTNDGLTMSPVSQIGLVATISPNYIGFIRYPAGQQVKNTVLTSGGFLGSAVASGILTGDPLTGTILKNVFGLGSHKSYITASYSPIICSCRPSGGYPPYTYLWQWISGDNGFRVSNETLPNVTFARQDNPGGNTAYWVCAVTDSLGNTINSNQVRVHQP